MGALALASVLIRPLAGPLTDRWGRRPVLVAGALLFGGAPVLYALCHNVTPLLAARVAHGIGLALFTTAYQALVADLTPPGRRGEGLGMAGVASTGRALRRFHRLSFAVGRRAGVGQHGSGLRGLRAAGAHRLAVGGPALRLAGAAGRVLGGLALVGAAMLGLAYVSGAGALVVLAALFFSPWSTPCPSLPGRRTPAGRSRAAHTPDVRYSKFLGMLTSWGQGIQ